MASRDEQHGCQAAQRAKALKYFQKLCGAPCSSCSGWKQGTFPHESHLICDRHEDIEYISATLAHVWIGEIRFNGYADGAQKQVDGCEFTGRHGVVRSRRIFCGAMTAVAMCLAQSAFALDPRYPDWPCQQLKVPEISIASVWNGPSIDAIDTTKPADPKQAELVAHLVARRTPIEDARKLIADYLVGTDEEKQQKAKRLFAALYSTLNGQRDQVMNGIERFSRKQKGMAEEIRAKAQKMREVQDQQKDNSDPAQSSELASELSWQTRIFEDRRRSTSYLCDVPVLIEKRLFDLGRAIEDNLSAGAQMK